MSDTGASSGGREFAPRPKQRSRLRLSIGRHPRDVIRLVIAAAALTLCTLLTLFPTINPVEVAIFDELGKLPAASRPLWTVLTWFGSWPGIVVVTGVALYLKRIRVGLKCVAAGALAWGVSLIINWLHGGRPALSATFPGQLARLPVDFGFSFPSAHVAVVAALATVVGPYLGRGLRNVAWTITALVGVADVYLGGHLPLGALAGGFLGWGVGTLFHLVWGAPGRKTSAEAIQQELELAGLAPVAVLPVKHHPLGPRQFAVHTAGGENLRVEVVRRMHRRAGGLYKLRRLLASLEVQDEPRLSTTHHEVEHEAFVTLLAERAGVRTPQVLLACELKHGSPLLVRKEVKGRRLQTLRAADIDDKLLLEIWSQIGCLAQARIAHHDLRAKNILIDDSGHPWLLNFTFSRPGADATHCAQDVAEALISLGTLVGVKRTVSTAADTLPADQLEAALQYLHPLALPRRIRMQIDTEARYLVTELREGIAERLDCAIPGFRSPLRPATIISLLLIGAAVYLLLPQLSGMGAVLRSLRSANWTWLAAAVVAGLLAIVMSAVSILGSSHVRLPLWRTVAVQIAAAFTGRTTPGGAGFFGINIAYLERLGVRRSRAVGITVLNLTGTGFVATVCCVVGVFGVGVTGVLRNVSIPTGWPVLVAVAAVLIVLGLLVGSPFGRRRIVRPSLAVARDLLATLHHPVRAAQLFGGALAYLLVTGLGLAASLAAFDPHFSLLAVLTVFVVGQTLGHLAPAPGGLGAVEAVMVAGLTAVGIAPTVAIAGVLTFRLLTYWLPVLPGIATFRYLQHRGVI
ncbi:MAG: lysylphosphatidylglycerol synthase domain-containing protein [Sciscionella sp.]